jgi:hypothetical protein
VEKLPSRKRTDVHLQRHADASQLTLLEHCGPSALLLKQTPQLVTKPFAAKPTGFTAAEEPGNDSVASRTRHSGTFCTGCSTRAPCSSTGSCSRLASAMLIGLRKSRCIVGQCSIATSWTPHTPPLLVVRSSCRHLLLHGLAAGTLHHSCPDRLAAERSGEALTRGARHCFDDLILISTLLCWNSMFAQPLQRSAHYVHSRGAAPGAPLAPQLLCLPSPYRNKQRITLPSRSPPA